MSVTIYHNPRCGKSRNTLKLIEEAGITPEIILYLQDPPSVDELASLLEKLGVGPEQIMRKKEAREEGIAELTGSELIAGLAAHPRAIERPIVVRGDKAILGRPPENVLALLG